MKRFSWYTDGKPHISTYLNGAPKKRYLVVDGIDVVGRAVMQYKPNMKGGHTHNHIYNKLHKHIFRGRNARKSVSRKDKPEFVKTAYLNIKLGNVTWDSLIHTIFHHNKKENK